MPENLNHIISVVIIYALGALCAGEVLYKGRTSQGKIAWIISLILMPVLAIPAYFLFGSRKFYGYVLAHKEGRAPLDKLLVETNKVIENNKVLNTELNIYEKISNLLTTKGNKVDVFNTGKTKYENLFKDIEEATKSILIEYYIISNDKIGEKLKELLKKKAEQGLKIYLICDYIGSFSIKHSYMNDLRKSGVKAHFFRTTKFGRRGQVNFRNHRKLVIIDDTVAYTGGMNLGEEYTDKSWSDMHLRLEGPIVSSLQFTFLMDYNWAKDDDDPLPAVTMDKHRVHKNGVEALAVASGPADDKDTCQL